MKNICICMPFTKGNVVIIATSLNFAMCSRKFNNVLLYFFFLMLCFVISVSDSHCSSQTFWIGLFSLNPDEGFARSDGSPVNILIFLLICLLKMFWGLYWYPHQRKH